MTTAPARPEHPADFVRRRMEYLGVDETVDAMLKLNIKSEWIDDILRRREELPPPRFIGLFHAIAKALQLPPDTLREVQDSWNNYTLRQYEAHSEMREARKREVRCDGRN